MDGTIGIWGELNNVADPNVNHTEEALVLLLELLLVKNLNGQYAVLIHSTVVALVRIPTVRHLGIGAQIKALVPVRAEGALGHGGGLRLLAIDGRNGKWVRKACDSVSRCEEAGGMNAGPYERHRACKGHQRR